MTALGGQDVKRTFFVVWRDWTGLPRLNTHEPKSQNIGNFGDVIRRVYWHQAKVARPNSPIHVRYLPLALSGA
jgi:hypothetical protein